MNGANGATFIEFAERRDHGDVTRAVGEITRELVQRDAINSQTIQALNAQLMTLLQTLIKVETEFRTRALELLHEGRTRRWQAGRFARICTLGLIGWRQAKKVAAGTAEDLERLMASVQASNQHYVLAAIEGCEPLLRALGLSREVGTRRLIEAVEHVLPPGAGSLLRQTLSVDR